MEFRVCNSGRTEVTMTNSRGQNGLVVFLQPRGNLLLVCDLERKRFNLGNLGELAPKPVEFGT
jgi:hypothetical protein